MDPYDRWEEQAHENVEKWGLQGPETLALAMTEELGELVQAILQYNWEDGEFDAIEDELCDLMAVGIAVQWWVNGTDLRGDK